METFSRYWPFVRGFCWLPLDSFKRQWCEALIFSLIWTWTNDRANTRDAADLRRHRAHYDDTIMIWYHGGGRLPLRETQHLICVAQCKSCLVMSRRREESGDYQIVVTLLSGIFWAFEIRREIFGKPWCKDDVTHQCNLAFCFFFTV